MGFFLTHNATHLQVTHQHTLVVLKQKFGVTVSLCSVLNYCASNRLSKLVAKVHKGAREFTLVDQVELGIEFIGQLLEKEFCDTRRSAMCNTDVTFTSHRNRVVKTIGPQVRSGVFSLFCLVLASKMLKYSQASRRMFRITTCIWMHFFSSSR